MTDLEATLQNRVTGDYVDAEQSSEQVSSYPSATELQSPEAERIFNLTGTSKLSSEHIAKLHSTPAADQIGAWTPSNISSSQSVHGKFVPPSSGWIHYDKHMHGKKSSSSISKPGRVETDAVKRLNAQRDAIRAAQAEREAARKTLEEQAAAAKAEEELQAKRADIEQRRQARADELARRQNQFQEVDQNYKQYIAGRKEPLFRTLEENFKVAQRDRDRAKVQEYNESLRPPKLRTVHSILTGASTRVPPRQRASGTGAAAAPSLQSGAKGGPRPTGVGRSGQAAVGRARRSARGSASADGSVQAAGQGSRPETVDRACSPFIFPTADGAGPQDASGAAPTRAEDGSEVLDLSEFTAPLSTEAEDSAVRPSESGKRQSRDPARRSNSSLQALKERRTSSLRRMQTTASYKSTGAKAFASGGDDDAKWDEAAVQDPAAKVSARLAKLHFTRQFSADERDDQHALSMTDPMPEDEEATVDAEVPDTYFVERDELDQPLTPEGGLTASLSNMAAYDPDPPLDFGAAAAEGDVAEGDAPQPDETYNDQAEAGQGEEQEDGAQEYEQQDDDNEPADYEEQGQEQQDEDDADQDGYAEESTQELTEGQEAQEVYLAQAAAGDFDEEQQAEQDSASMAEEASQGQADADEEGTEAAEEAESEGLAEAAEEDSIAEPYQDAAFDGPEVQQALPEEDEQELAQQDEQLAGYDIADKLPEQLEREAAGGDADDVSQGAATGAEVQSDAEPSFDEETAADAAQDAESAEIDVQTDDAESEVAASEAAQEPAQPGTEQFTAEALNQDNELIGYVFDKAAQDGLVQDDMTGAEEGQETSGEPQAEGTAASVPAEATGITGFDSMYEEESMLSTDGTEAYMAPADTMQRTPSGVPSLNLSPITDAQASRSQDIGDASEN